MHVCTNYNMERPESNSTQHASRFGWIAVSSAAVVLLCQQPGFGTDIGPGLTSLPSAEQVIQRQAGPLQRARMPQGKATSEVIDLTIEDALDRGLKYNLGLYLSERATDQTRASRLRALSNLMPVINGAFTEEEQKINLKAFGFNFPGFPSFGWSLRPDRTASRRQLELRSTCTTSISLHAASQNVKAAQFSYQDARDTVVLAVGANYLLTIANESRVDCSRGRIESGTGAVSAGCRPGECRNLLRNIDTLRARVQLQTQQEIVDSPHRTIWRNNASRWPA